MIVFGPKRTLIFTCLMNLTPSDTVLEMKFFRSIAVILILALASSPALAAICATSCVSQAVMSSLHPDNMSGMKNCHKGTMNKDKTKFDIEHKSCSMSAGCHFTQLTSPIVSSLKYIFIDSTAISFPKFVSSAKSIDLSPPLKPPA